MIKNNKPLILYLIFNLMFYIILLSSFLFFEHEQKSQISNATTRLIREKFLIKDLTGLTRDIEKIRADNFTKIITLDNKNVIITKTVNSENFINLKIKRYIWSDSDQKNLKGVIIFYFSLDHILIITLKILFYSLIVTFPLSLMILSHLKKQQFEAIEIEKNKTLNKFTRQMSHDIRSPIASLHQIFESNHKLTDQEIKIFKSSLDRIDYIANQYLNLSKKTYKAASFQNLREIIKEISNEKMHELKGLDIILNLKDLDAFFIKEELGRIISNLINNSYEATLSNPKIIEITIFEYCNFNVIQIKDYGIGIPDNVIKQVGIQEITTKTSGNGLGILHAIETLQEWDATLNIKNTNSNGTVIEISFPKFNLDVILIDDDELVRLTWESKAKRQNITLKTFESYELFFNSKNLINKESKIYIDSELGENVKGEEIALLLNIEGFSNISMTTGHSEENFAKYTFLKSVISKSPSF